MHKASHKARQSNTCSYTKMGIENIILVMLHTSHLSKGVGFRPLYCCACSLKKAGSPVYCSILKPAKAWRIKSLALPLWVTTCAVVKLWSATIGGDFLLHKLLAMADNWITDQDPDYHQYRNGLGEAPLCERKSDHVLGLLSQETMLLVASDSLCIRISFFVRQSDSLRSNACTKYGVQFSPEFLPSIAFSSIHPPKYWPELDTQNVLHRHQLHISSLSMSEADCWTTRSVILTACFLLQVSIVVPPGKCIELEVRSTPTTKKAVLYNHVPITGGVSLWLQDAIKFPPESGTHYNWNLQANELIHIAEVRQPDDSQSCYLLPMLHDLLPDAHRLQSLLTQCGKPHNFWLSQ